MSDAHLEYSLYVCVGRILRRLHDKYDTILHFYFARNLRSYMKRRTNNHESILFADLQFFDCDDEFLKRCYRSHQTADRIKLLAAYFKRNRVLPHESPFIRNERIRTLLEKRVKRRTKTAKRVKELDQGEPFAGDGDFIRSINTSILDASEQAYQSRVRVSYSSKLFDIYAGTSSNGHSQRSSSSHASVVKTSLITLPLTRNNDREERNYDTGDVEHLVCNFNDRDTERIMREYAELTTARQQPVPKLNLNLSKLSRSREDLRNKPSYEQFYEQVKKKREEKRANKVYYVKEAQRKYQLTSRSPESEYMFLTSRDYPDINRQHGTTTKDDSQLHSDRIFYNNNRMLSPELVRGDAVKMYRTGATKVLEAPILTDRKSERQNHYRSILDRIRENKKQQMLLRAGSPQNSQQRQEKNRKLEQLKERAVELLSRSKPPLRVETSPRKEVAYSRK